MIRLPALDLFLYVTKVTASTSSKPAKGTTIASWLQQSSQQRSYLRKYKNYHRETQCVHSYTGLIMTIPGVRQSYAVQQNDISNFTKEVIVGKVFKLQIDL